MERGYGEWNWAVRVGVGVGLDVGLVRLGCLYHWLGLTGGVRLVSMSWVGLSGLY